MDWFKRVFHYFALVDRRPMISSTSVLPSAPNLIGIFAILFVAVCLFVLFVDPLFEPGCQGCNVSTKQLFQITTELGKSSWVLAVSGVLLVLLSAYRNGSWSGIKFTTWHDCFLKVYFTFSTVAFSGLLAVLFKNIFGRARPQTIEGFDIWTSSPFGGSYAYASFPSGHSTTIAALAMTGWLLFPRFRILFVAVALWVGISRVPVGAHFPSDVLAGLFLGAFFTWIYARRFAAKRLLFKFSDDGTLILRNKNRWKRNQENVAT